MGSSSGLITIVAMTLLLLYLTQSVITYVSCLLYVVYFLGRRGGSCEIIILIYCLLFQAIYTVSQKKPGHKLIKLFFQTLNAFPAFVGKITTFSVTQ